MKPLIALSFVAALFSCGGHDDNREIKNVPGESIKEYVYSYSGTMMWYIDWYKIDRGEDGDLRLSCSHDGPDITIYRCPSDALQKIDGIVREYSLWNLKEHYRPDFEVLDGYSWHMYISYGEAGLSTGGFNAWPKKRLAEGLSKIQSYVESIIESSTEDDVVGTDSHLRED